MTPRRAFLVGAGVGALLAAAWLAGLVDRFGRPVEVAQ